MYRFSLLLGLVFSIRECPKEDYLQEIQADSSKCPRNCDKEPTSGYFCTHYHPQYVSDENTRVCCCGIAKFTEIVRNKDCKQKPVCNSKQCEGCDVCSSCEPSKIEDTCMDFVHSPKKECRSIKSNYTHMCWKNCQRMCKFDWHDDYNIFESSAVLGGVIALGLITLAVLAFLAYYYCKSPEVNEDIHEAEKLN